MNQNRPIFNHATPGGNTEAPEFFLLIQRWRGFVKKIGLFKTFYHINKHLSTTFLLAYQWRPKENLKLIMSKPRFRNNDLNKGVLLHKLWGITQWGTGVCNKFYNDRPMSFHSNVKNNVKFGKLNPKIGYRIMFKGVTVLFCPIKAKRQ